MHPKAAGALQEQPLFEVPKDNQAGNPHTLSPGLKKHVKSTSDRLQSEHCAAVQRLQP